VATFQSITNPPLRAIRPFFPQPPRQPYALQTLCHSPGSFKRRAPSSYSHTLFGPLTIPQVRAVVAPSDDLILSASRDSTAISWIKEPGTSFSPTYTFRAGPRFINSVAYLKPTPEAPQGERRTRSEPVHLYDGTLLAGYIVTGGQDSIINIWMIGPSQEEPLYNLLGHSDNVCALHVGEDGTIISGSWDKCALP
jgi:WD40 repeat protein